MTMEPQALIQIVKPLPEGNEKIGRVEIEDIHPGLVLPVKQGNPDPIPYTSQTATALSLTTTMVDDYGVLMKLMSIAVTFGDGAGTPTAPTTSENLTLTLMPAGGRRPATVLYSGDAAALSMTSMEKRWLGGRKLVLGDELILAYTNTDTRAIEAEIMLERA